MEKDQNCASVLLRQVNVSEVIEATGMAATRRTVLISHTVGAEVGVISGIGTASVVGEPYIITL